MMKQLLLTIAVALAAFPQSYEYDAAGRLSKVANPDGTGILYTYDAADNMLAARSINLPPAPSGLEISQSNSGVNQLSWTPSPGATRYIVYRQRVGSSMWEEIGRVTGPSYSDLPASGAEYRYRIAAISANGTSANSASAIPSSPAVLQLTVAESGARAVRTTGLTAGTRGGYAELDVEAGATPYGVAIFQYSQNGVLVSESAVPASPPTVAGRIFIDYRPGATAVPGQFAGAFAGTVNVNTGFGIANPSTSDAGLQFTLRDAGGRIVASGRGVLRAGAHTATLLSDLPGFASGFLVPTGFTAGSLDIESDVPISIMALRVTVNQRSEVLFTSTPVADLSLPAEPGPLYFPHFADGGGFTTAVILMNTTAQQLTGVVEFREPDGGALAVSSITGASGSAFRYTLPAGGVLVMESRGELADTRAGWIRVTPDGTQNRPQGAGIFRLARQGNLISESGIPAALPTTRALLYVDRTQGRDTGLAVANPGGAESTVRLSARIPSGSVQATLGLRPRGHVAQLTGDLLQLLPRDFVGVLELSAPAPFLALTLRLQTNPRGDLLMSTLPLADQTRAAPEPVVFPHLADGGGFRTELILIGPASVSQTVLRLRDDNGAPLEIAEAQ